MMAIKVPCGRPSSLDLGMGTPDDDPGSDAEADIEGEAEPEAEEVTDALGVGVAAMQLVSNKTLTLVVGVSANLGVRCGRNNRLGCT